jgi:predicted kinase
MISLLQLICETSAKYPVDPYLHEGIDDQGAYKAIIMVGGPGSGKSYISSQLFGISSGLQFTSSGLRVVNSDVPFEHMLKKYGYSTNFSNLSDEDAEKIGIVGNNKNSLRSKAKQIRDVQQSRYEEQGTGMIIDNTGENIRKIKTSIDRLRKNGYDVTVVHIDTPVEVALERNRLRERRLSDNMVEKIHFIVGQNMKELKEMLGDDMVTIENGDGMDVKQFLQSKLNKVIQHKISEPIKNPVGVQTIKKLRGAAITKSGRRQLGVTKKNNTASKISYQEILDMPIKNPSTGKIIKVRTAISYEKTHPVYRAATALIRQQLGR